MSSIHDTGFTFIFLSFFSKSLGTSSNKCLLTDYIYELTLRKCHISRVKPGPACNKERGGGRAYL